MTLSAVVLALAMQTPTSAIPAANPKDVATQDSIINALYDVISGPIGHKRDWDRFRSLFAPHGRLTSTGRTPKGEFVMNSMTPDEYAKTASKFLEERGFFERESKRKSETVQGMTMAWSDYESRWKPDDKEPFQTGTNAIQMFTDGKRWFLLSVLWQAK